MVQKKKKGKDRLDKYYYLAKQQGYRSRAAFKLVQLNKKFNFLEKANVVIDLCAAPGSWMQVAQQLMPISKVIVGVDLDPIKPIPNASSFVGDITTAKCRQEIKKIIKNAKADVVLHDGAPNVGTAWVQDAYNQAELTLSACKLATEFLKVDGTFVTKVFRSAEYNKLLWVFNQLFKKVSPTKPKASRNSSAEIFVVCEGFIAPKKLDPKLLDPKHVLKPIESGSYNKTIFSKKDSVNRSGYDDDVGAILFKKKSVQEFIDAEDPVEFLGKLNQISFNDEDGSSKYESLDITTDEIKECLKDLKVLNKKDFSSILRWRGKIRTMLKEDLEANKMDDEDADRPLTKEEEEERMIQELDKDMTELERDKKRKKKKKKETIMKQKKRMAYSVQGDFNDDHGEGEDALFDLKSINTHALEELGMDEMMEEEEVEDEESSEDEEGYFDPDEEGRRYQEEMEDYFDTMYLQYLQTKKKDRKRAISKLNEMNEEDETLFNASFDEDSEHEEEDNDLVVAPKKDQKIETKMWFDQDEFKSLVDEDDDEEIEIKKRMAMMNDNKRRKIKDTTDEDLVIEEPSDDEHSSFEEIVHEDGKRKKKKERIRRGKDDKKEKESSFEVVKQEVFEHDDDSLDDDDKSEILALAKKMMKKDSRTDILDSSLNKRFYGDTDSLPQWFSDEERSYNYFNAPVTKEEINEMKEKLKAINARDPKKVAEAKARKRRKLQQSLDKAKAKAAKIMESEEITDGSKLKEIEKIYSKARSKNQQKKKYVVSKKYNASKKKGGVPAKGNTSIKHVDSRMKKDKRSQDKKRKRKRK